MTNEINLDEEARFNYAERLREIATDIEDRNTDTSDAVALREIAGILSATQQSAKVDLGDKELREILAAAYEQIYTTQKADSIRNGGNPSIPVNACLEAMKMLDAPVHPVGESVERLVGILESIAIYGSDTLSGRVDGGPDDRKWQRDAVLEMTRRARTALAPFTKEQANG